MSSSRHTLRALLPTDSVSTSPLGCLCPYWTVHEGTVYVADTAPDILSRVPITSRIIDPVAVLELLHFNYVLGDRTLIQGINRMPWHSTLYGDGRLERRPPIPHGTRHVEPAQAARLLRALLEEELGRIVENRQRVFLLLTGGLDSRVTAGVLKALEPTTTARFVAVTWGHPHSRDVAYAKRIASWFDWEWIHLPYDVELTRQNILRGALWGGAEVAGFHLHAMEWFHHANPPDLVIAASFGDSIGRAEYSSVHVTQLRHTPIENSRSLIHPRLHDEAVNRALLDRATAWESEPSLEDWIRCELDAQENYMRRMIGHAMDYIRQYCCLHQAFTSEALVRFMWSLCPEDRRDHIYQSLLKDLDARLFSLPWARTGAAPNGNIERDPSLRRDYHELTRWLYSDLREFLDELISSPELATLGVFLGPALRTLRTNWVGLNEGSLGLGEHVVNVASVELLRREFSIMPCRGATPVRDIFFDRNTRLRRQLWLLKKRLRGT